MASFVTRREWLVRAACTGAAAVPCCRLLAQSPGDLAVVELGERIAVVKGAGANITVCVGSQSLLLVDGGLPERTSDVLHLLGERWPDKAVREVFNTNWRLEHTGSNEAFRNAGARVHAHENTKLWMGARFEVEWQNVRHLPRPAAALPSSTFYGSGSIEFDGTEVRYGYLPRAHTDGDVYVHFPADKVLVAGDLLAVESYPVVDYETGGWIGGMVDATRSLLTVSDADTLIVPAEGDVQSRQALEAQLALCEAVMQEVRATYRAGGTLEDFFAADPTAGFGDHRGDPTLFLSLVYEGAYYN